MAIYVQCVLRVGASTKGYGGVSAATFDGSKIAGPKPEIKDPAAGSGAAAAAHPIAAVDVG